MQALNVSGHISTGVCLLPEPSRNSEPKPRRWDNGLAAPFRNASSDLFLFRRQGCSARYCNGVEQGLAEPEEELALSLSPVPLGKVLPPRLTRAELERNLSGRVSLGWPRDKLQPRRISATINGSYIKANNKLSSNLQVLTLRRRCWGARDGVTHTGSHGWSMAKQEGMQRDRGCRETGETGSKTFLLVALLNKTCRRVSSFKQKLPGRFNPAFIWKVACGECCLCWWFEEERGGFSREWWKCGMANMLQHQTKSSVESAWSKPKIALVFLLMGFFFFS